MDQLSKVLLAIDKSHTVSYRVVDCRPGLGGLNQVYGPNRPTFLMWMGERGTSHPTLISLQLATMIVSIVLVNK